MRGASPSLLCLSLPGYAMWQHPGLMGSPGRVSGGFVLCGRGVENEGIAPFDCHDV